MLSFAKLLLHYWRVFFLHILTRQDTQSFNSTTIAVFTALAPLNRRQSFWGRLFATHHTESLSPRQQKAVHLIKVLKVFILNVCTCLLASSVTSLYSLPVVIHISVRWMRRDSEPLSEASALFWHWQIHTLTMFYWLKRIQQIGLVVFSTKVVEGCWGVLCATLVLRCGGCISWSWSVHTLLELPVAFTTVHCL